MTETTDEQDDLLRSSGTNERMIPRLSTSGGKLYFTPVASRSWRQLGPPVTRAKLPFVIARTPRGYPPWSSQTRRFSTRPPLQEPQRLRDPIGNESSRGELGDRATHHSHWEVVRFRKPWLDVRAPLALRVQSLLSAPPMLHPADATSEEVYHLIQQCCKCESQRQPSNSSSVEASKETVTPLQGLTWAQDVLERLVLEKKQRLSPGATRMMKTPPPVNEPTQSTSSIATGSWDPSELAVPWKLWNLILFGWARQLSTKERGNHGMQTATVKRIAPMRMRQVLERALEEALWDEQVAEAGKHPRGLKSAASDETNYRKDASIRSVPTVELFNTYLHGLAESAAGVRTAHRQAISTLSQMQELHEQRGWHCRPNTRSYTQALLACANAARSHSYHKATESETPAYMALSLLRQMKVVHESEKKAYLEQYQVPYDTHHPLRNRRRIVTADTIAYTTTMHVLVHTISFLSSNQPRRRVFQRQQQELVKRVLDLLQEMMDCRDGTARVDSAAFVVAQQALAKLAASNQQTPSGRVRAARHCHRLLTRRLELAARYQAMLDDHSGREHSTGEHSDGLIQLIASDMIDADGLRVSFNVCLDAWSKSEASTAVEECESILKTMLSTEAFSMLPDSDSFRACLHAWSVSLDPSAADSAYELLKLQKELVASGALPNNALPDFQSYAIVILTVARSNAIGGSEKVARARALLEELIEGIKGGTIKAERNATAPFTAVLTAAAHSLEVSEPSPVLGHPGSENLVDTNEDNERLREAIYSVALETYQEVKDDKFSVGARPDHHLYAAMLRVVAAAFPVQSPHPNASISTVRKSLPTERVTMADRIMKDAQATGQVSRLVLQAWSNALASTVDASIHDIVGEEENQLPKLWVRNVNPAFRYRVLKARSDIDRS